MYTFKKGDADYQVMLNENFSEITDALENGALVSKKTVIKAQDWDEILDKGIYTVFGASGANRPYSGAAYGALVVYADNTFVSQTYMYKGETYTRSRQGSPATWTPWNKLANVSQLNNEVLLNRQPIKFSDGTVTLLDSVSNYEAVKFICEYQGNRTDATILNNKSGEIDIRSSAINIYDDPTSNGWDMGEMLIHVSNNEINFTYAKTISKSGTIETKTNNLRVIHVIGVKKAPQLPGI
ncbi:pyocin knob domain-containing protein [Enterococcus faecalis]|uniref:pyocin knob domain-containing protein n=1 Tax=Enterococcus faecalis TaxID=1351 RepID=UPI000CF030F1|nr:pyocin knob domain-containing protein [Enterococcus faecalis]EGO8292323.1 hypothetical protein [Enterococcus faecalis]EKZ0187801.1 hypothetical protein [Enterococcus faecalis]ELZ4696691.1 hypothetical protein [Enterococcus faecalis]PQD25860.1 hypothetical protein CUM75_04230 [Enterococcus faecalis]PQD34188.1 hypothetical protein CUM64_05255 [Enterococcus faecalis]